MATLRDLPMHSIGFEMAPIPLFVADGAWRLLAGNRAFGVLTDGLTGSVRFEQLVIWTEREERCLAKLAMLSDILIEVEGRGSRVGRWFELQLRVVSGDTFESRLYFGAFHEITARKHREQELRHHASHDVLTGLPRRPLIMERIEQALAHSGRDPGYRFAILFLDLDRFKVINDSFGHLIGDQLLVAAAERIRNCLQRAGDALARFGGDEFVILLDDCQDYAHAARVAERIQESLRKPFRIADRDLYTGSSIGIVLSDGAAGGDPHQLLRAADTAMYRAKAHDKGGYQVFDRTMHDAAVALFQREMELRRAVELGEFELHYQPVLSVGTAEVLKFEAFIRWRSERGLVPPQDFLELAEETGLIIRIGDWVLRHACLQARAWRQAGYPMRVAVNLSALQFQDRDLPSKVRQALADSGLEPETLCLEVAESAVLADPDEAVQTLDQLRKLGITIVVDDFGTGCFSLANLRKMPVDAFKIDQSLVSGLLGETDVAAGDAAIIKAVIALGHSMGLQVMAEGVEHARQVSFLRAHGCDALQGHYFHRALDLAELDEFLNGLERIETPGAPVRYRLAEHPTIAAAALDDTIGGGVSLAARAPDPGIPGTDEEEPVATLGGMRVLVIEDQDSSRYAVSMILEFHGAEVFQATTAAEALAQLRGVLPDVLISDISLPDEDGYSLLRRIRQLPADEGGTTPAIALTGHVRSEDRIRALQAGFQTHAAKPIEPAELVAVVASLATTNAAA